MLVYFRGHGDWFVNDTDGQPKYLIKAEDRGSHINSPLFTGFKFYRPCDLVDGVFKLTKSDETIYLRTGKLTKDNNGLLLLPCSFEDDKDSVFAKIVDKGLLNADAFDRCYFKIAINRYSSQRLRSKPELAEEGKLDYVMEPIKQDKPTIGESETSQVNKVVRESAAMHSNRSEGVKILIMASEKFWANAGRDDITTCPYNDEVEEWLKKQGFSKRQAEAGATIIRPEWAPTGRRSGK